MAVAGVAIAFPGTGQFDASWVQTPDWQRRARMLTDIGMQALAAAKAKDQAKMQQVGDQLVRLCNDCHMQFKPEIPRRQSSCIPSITTQGCMDALNGRSRKKEE
jgi:hypothetical protein